jgi:hypothetical protein
VFVVSKSTSPPRDEIRRQSDTSQQALIRPPARSLVLLTNVGNGSAQLGNKLLGFSTGRVPDFRILEEFLSPVCETTRSRSNDRGLHLQYRIECSKIAHDSIERIGIGFGGRYVWSRVPFLFLFLLISIGFDLSLQVAGALPFCSLLLERRWLGVELCGQIFCAHPLLSFLHHHSLSLFNCALKFDGGSSSLSSPSSSLSS